MKIKFAVENIPQVWKGIPLTQDQWQDWRWQMRQSLSSLAQFESLLSLTEEERLAFSNSLTAESNEKIFNIRTTPYYASLMNPELQDQDPLRKIMVPHFLEKHKGLQQMLDPLGEKKNNPAPRIIHRYSDRILFLVTDFCSVYCRYCTRKHFTGNEQVFPKQEEYQKALNYIQTHPGIREVILSGGDPLTLGDEQLQRVFEDLRRIDHVEIIRVGSRMPVVCPMRMTEQLARLFQKYKPVYLMTHFNHPRELTQTAAQALERFVDHGVPVFNQMVLLNGVNNDAAIVQALSRRLIYLRVKPYYMHQCDPSMGTDHLRTSIENSLEIQQELWGHLSGLAMPTLSVDIPDGAGKAYYVPDFEIEKTESGRRYRGWDGVEAEYINPPASAMIKPADHHLYLQEWEEIKNSKIST
jgi:lysine 2,3-aminomutase